MAAKFIVPDGANKKTTRTSVTEKRREPRKPDKRDEPKKVGNPLDPEKRYRKPKNAVRVSRVGEGARIYIPPEEWEKSEIGFDTHVGFVNVGGGKLTIVRREV